MADQESSVVMSADKVRTLARLMHLQEAQNARTMTFRSPLHRTRYLQDSRKSYETATGILDSMEDEKSKHQQDKDRSTVLEYLYETATFTVGSACRTMWSLHLREEYLKKIRSFAVEKAEEINTVMNNSELVHDAKLEKLDGIMKELTDYKQVSMDTMRSRQNPTARNFARFWRKLTFKHPENMFQHMVNKYRRKLIEVREIKMSDLDGKVPGKGILPDNAEVYSEITASSGFPSYPKLAKFAKGAGRALLVFQLGMIVWDVCESQRPGMTLAKDTTSLVVSLGAGVAGEAIGTAVATATLGALGLATTTLVGSGIVLAASFATGVGVAIVAGIAIGWLFTKLFESGGNVSKKVINHHPPKEHTNFVLPHPSTEHLMMHFTPIVDGERLALQLTAAASMKA